MGDVIQLFPGSVLEQDEESPESIELAVQHFTEGVITYIRKVFEETLLVHYLDEITKLCKQAVEPVYTIKPSGNSLLEAHAPSSVHTPWLLDIFYKIERSHGGRFTAEQIDAMTEVLSAIESSYLPNWLLSNEEVTLEELIERRLFVLAQASRQEPDAFVRSLQPLEQSIHIRDLLAPLLVA